MWVSVEQGLGSQPERTLTAERDVPVRVQEGLLCCGHCVEEGEHPSRDALGSGDHLGSCGQADGSASSWEGEEKGVQLW